MFSPNGLKAVIFDLDGTLKIYRPEGAQAFADYAASLGLPISPEDRLRALRWEHYYWASSPELADDMAAYPKGEDDFWINYGRRYLTACGASPEQAREFAGRVHSYMKDHFRPEHGLAEGALEALKHLKAHGFILGVLSNRDQPFGPELDELGLGPYLDFSLAGGEVDAFKPDPEIFQHTLQRTRTTASETVYVGDNYFADVVGARRAGLQPVLYDPRHLYPEAGCPSITSFDQLIPVLKTL
jgi:FMN phosphatase YigB (HAD superfamily)